MNQVFAPGIVLSEASISLFWDMEIYQLKCKHRGEEKMLRGEGKALQFSETEPPEVAEATFILMCLWSLHFSDLRQKYLRHFVAQLALEGQRSQGIEN